MRLLGKDEHPIRLAFLAATLSLAYLAILLPSGFLESARLRSHDAYCRWQAAITPPPKESSDLLLVTVDEESLRHLGKKWPWDRELSAEFLNKLSKAEPRLVSLDFVFSGASNPESDQALAQAIQSGPPVLLAAYMDHQGDPVLPNTLFTDAKGETGLINHPRDIDLTVRRFFASIPLPMHPQPLFSTEIQAVAMYRHIPPDQLRIESRSQLFIGSQRVPLEPPAGCVGIHYVLSPASISSVSFWQVMEGQIDPARIRGKIVLVGATGEITHDVYSTPLGLMPGVVINANGILTLLTGQFIRPLPIFLTLPLGLALVLSVMLMAYWLPFLWAALAIGLLTLISVAIGFLSVLWFNIRAESLSIFILIATAWAGAVLYKYLLLFAESARLHRHVLTDPVSGAVTERYFRLRMEADWPQWKNSRRPASMLVIQMDPISAQLLQSAWPEVQKKLQSLVETLQRHLKTTRGALIGRLKEDRLAVFLPGLDLHRAKSWVETVRSALQSVPGHLSFGLAGNEQTEMSSATHLLLAADTASRRAWSMENRQIEAYNPAADKVVLPDGSGAEGKQNSDALEYVASELEDRNRAIEKALNDLRLAHKEMENHFLEVTKTLVMALETKDAYTAGHLERVSRYSTRLAEVLRLPQEEVEAIREAALLHDIGKIGLPDEVLHKVGRLTDEEVGIIRQHLAIGAKILEPMKFFKPITSLIYHHHERYDGKGYPHGLTGEFIPPGAQVIAIADSFDAMTTNRGYNKPLNIHEALEELQKGSGTQFNPTFVEAFIQVVQREGPQLAGYTPHHQ